MSIDLMISQRIPERYLFVLRLNRITLVWLQVQLNKFIVVVVVYFNDGTKVNLEYWYKDLPSMIRVLCKNTQAINESVLIGDNVRAEFDCWDPNWIFSDYISSNKFLRFVTIDLTQQYIKNGKLCIEIEENGLKRVFRLVEEVNLIDDECHSSFLLILADKLILGSPPPCWKDNHW